MRGGCFAFGAQRLHHALDEELGFAKLFGDEADIHDGEFGVARGMAIDGVLADEDHGGGDAVEGDGETAAMAAHHGFVMFEFVLMLLKDGHGRLLPLVAAKERQSSVARVGTGAPARALL